MRRIDILNDIITSVYNRGYISSGSSLSIDDYVYVINLDFMYYLIDCFVYVLYFGISSESCYLRGLEIIDGYKGLDSEFSESLIRSGIYHFISCEDYYMSIRKL